MNNKLTLLAALLLFGSYYLTAQINYAFDEGDNYGDGTQAIVGQREYTWDVDTLNWDDVDSFYLQYNGQDQLMVQNYLRPNNGSLKQYQISQRMYDANGNILLQVDTTSNPTMGKRYEFTYNGNLEIQKITKGWSSSLTNWVNNYRYTTTYTPFNKVNVYLTEIWNITDNAFKNQTRAIHTYNAQNLDSIVTYENWNTVSNQWEGGARYFYTYDANGNKTSEIAEDYDVGVSLYKPNYKLEYTHDGSNQLATYIEYDWNTNTNLWEKKWKHTYTYNAQGLLETDLTEKWITNTLLWENLTFVTHTYDANHRLIQDLYQAWSNNMWNDENKVTYTRNGNGYRTRYLSEVWNTNTLSWRNWGAIDYWYANRVTPINGIAEQPEDKLFVYPNPANSPVVFVNAESNLPYTVYDITGRQVTQGKLQPGTNSIILDEAKGIYLLKAGNSTTKIVKQ